MPVAWTSYRTATPGRWYTRYALCSDRMGYIELLPRFSASLQWPLCETKSDELGQDKGFK